MAQKLSRGVFSLEQVRKECPGEFEEKHGVEPSQSESRLRKGWLSQRKVQGSAWTIKNFRLLVIPKSIGGGGEKKS